jgi:haloalkane dehalogenase
MDMPILRTPDQQFSSLTNFPFEPHYIEVPDERYGPLRMHYLDEGEASAPVILCLHGQATWSYSYRRMIPLFVAAGYRVIAPDFIGFGRSDKLPLSSDYSYARHVAWLEHFIVAMKVKPVTAFMFDWGGYFGLPLVARLPEAFQRMVLATTTLPRGDSLLGALWVAAWRKRILKGDCFPISKMVDDMTDNRLSTETLKGLDAPYPDESYKTGPRQLPLLIPATGLNPASGPNKKAWRELSQCHIPTMTIVSERLSKRGFNPREFHKHIPGTLGQPHQVIKDAGFFIIEDFPELLAEKTLAFIGKTPV